MADGTDGFQAFPYKDYFGMSLRDYFAGQAVIPVLDNAVKLLLSKDKMMEPAEIARAAYKLADAMLMERKK